MMKKEKLAYTAPTTDILELRVESRIMDASPLYFYGGDGEAGREMEEDPEHNYSF